jgi:DNA-binding MarR family transcriptional regulator
MDINRDERMRLVQLVHMLDLLKGTYPTMSIQHAVALLRVAIQPGLSLTQLAESSGTPLASTSRHVKALRVANPRVPALLVSGFGKDDRTKAVLLTDDGRCLVSKLLTCLDGLVPERSLPEEGEAQNFGLEHPTCKSQKRIAWEPFRLI